eukprot:1006-Pelagococcus_subviridis.AAC.1
MSTAHSGAETSPVGAAAANAAASRASCDALYNPGGRSFSVAGRFGCGGGGVDVVEDEVVVKLALFVDGDVDLVDERGDGAALGAVPRSQTLLEPLVRVGRDLSQFRRVRQRSLRDALDSGREDGALARHRALHLRDRELRRRRRDRVSVFIQLGLRRRGRIARRLRRRRDSRRVRGRDVVQRGRERGRERGEGLERPGAGVVALGGRLRRLLALRERRRRRVDEFRERTKKRQLRRRRRKRKRRRRPRPPPPPRRPRRERQGLTQRAPAPSPSPPRRPRPASPPPTPPRDARRSNPRAPPSCPRTCPARAARVRGSDSPRSPRGRGPRCRSRSSDVPPPPRAVSRRTRPRVRRGVPRLEATARPWRAGLSGGPSRNR